MAKKTLRSFPQEQPYAPWPLLQVSAEDRRYVPVSESPLARRWRLARASLDVTVLDIWLAGGKGAIVGLFASAVTFTLIRWYNWWVGWHWAVVLGALVLLLLLAGIDLAVVVAAIAALVLGFGGMFAHPLYVLLFIGCGIILRCMIEFFPGRR